MKGSGGQQQRRGGAGLQAGSGRLPRPPYSPITRMRPLESEGSSPFRRVFRPHEVTSAPLTVESYRLRRAEIDAMHARMQEEAVQNTEIMMQQNAARRRNGAEMEYYERLTREYEVQERRERRRQEKMKEEEMARLVGRTFGTRPLE